MFAHLRSLVFFILAIEVTLTSLLVSPAVTDESERQVDGPSSHRKIEFEEAQISMVIVGDVMLGGSMKSVLRKHGSHYPFEKTVDILSSADLTIGNLEAPFGTGGEPFDKKYTFLVPNEMASGLSFAGFDLFALANNHILDYGTVVLQQTMDTLDSLGIGYAGAGLNLERARMPYFWKGKGVSIAFLSYSNTFPLEFFAEVDKPGTSPGKPEFISPDVKFASERSDITIVYFHWGAEKWTQPKDYQIEFAHLAIDNGADLVIGSHSHVLQGMERYKQGLIFYSLGNFAFGSRSYHAKESLILRVRANKVGVVGVDLIPISVDNWKLNFQPTVLEDEAANESLEKFRNLTQSLGTDFEIENGIGKFSLTNLTQTSEVQGSTQPDKPLK